MGWDGMGWKWRGWGAPRELDEAEARGRVQRRPALVVAHVHVGAELLEQHARQLLRALAVRDAQLRANTQGRLLTAPRWQKTPGSARLGPARAEALPEPHTGPSNHTR